MIAGYTTCPECDAPAEIRQRFVLEAPTARSSTQQSRASGGTGSRCQSLIWSTACRRARGRLRCMSCDRPLGDSPASLTTTYVVGEAGSANDAEANTVTRRVFLEPFSPPRQEQFVTIRCGARAMAPLPDERTSNDTERCHPDSRCHRTKRLMMLPMHSAGSPSGYR